MIGMKHLVYAHRAVIPLVTAIYGWLYQGIAGRISPRSGRPLLSESRRRVLCILAAVLALVVQVVLLWLLGQMIDLCISLMEVWAELAAKHLSITLDRTA